MDHCIRRCLCDDLLHRSCIGNIHFLDIHANALMASSRQFVHYIISKLSFYTCYQNSHYSLSPYILSK